MIKETAVVYSLLQPRLYQWILNMLFERQLFAQRFFETFEDVGFRMSSRMIFYEVECPFGLAGSGHSSSNTLKCDTVFLVLKWTSTLHGRKYFILKKELKIVFSDRATNRPGMAGRPTVPELTSGVRCPGIGHVCPGIYWQPRCSKIEGRVRVSASFTPGK